MIAPAVPLLAFGLPHGMDWIWILVIVILIFGPKKLPDLARGIGRSLGEFRKAKDDFDRELKESMKDQPKPVAVSPVSPDPLAPVASSTASGTPGTPPGAVPPAPPLPVEPKKEA